MALVVETGAGLSGANSLASVADADAYLIARGVTAWEDADTSDKEIALVKASDYLRNERRFRYRGTKKAYVQRMPWPRTGAVELGGQEIPDNVVPPAVVDAACELAGLVIGGTDLQPVLARGGRVQSRTVGPISTSFMPDAPSEDTITAVLGLLEPYLFAGSDMDFGGAAPFLGGSSTTPTRLDLGMHDHPEANDANL